MGKSLNNNSIQHILPSTNHSPCCYTYPSTLSLESSGSWLQSGEERVTGSIIFSFFFFFWKELYDGPQAARCWNCWFLPSLSKVHSGLLLILFFFFLTLQLVLFNWSASPHYVWMTCIKKILHKLYISYLFALLPVSQFCLCPRLTFNCLLLNCP